MKPEPLNDNIRHSEGFIGGTMNLKEREEAIKKNRETRAYTSKMHDKMTKITDGTHVYYIIK